MDMKELLEEAADWVAADRDEIILSHTIGGETATLNPEARELVDEANDLIARLMDASRALQGGAR